VTRAYADESHHAGPPGFYLLAAAVFDDPGAVRARAAMRDLADVLGVTRVHWHALDHKRRELAMAVVAGLDFRAVVVVGSPVGRNQERARRKCLGTLRWELGQAGVTVTVLESRGQRLDILDLEAVDGFRKALVVPEEQRVEFEVPTPEPLLWVADAIAGAVASAERRPSRHLDSLRNRVELHRRWLI
jgi:hypothetical protein